MQRSRLRYTTQRMQPCVNTAQWQNRNNAHAPLCSGFWSFLFYSCAVCSHVICRAAAYTCTAGHHVTRRVARICDMYVTWTRHTFYRCWRPDMAGRQRPRTVGQPKKKARRTRLVCPSPFCMPGCSSLSLCQVAISSTLQRRSRSIAALAISLD